MFTQIHLEEVKLKLLALIGKVAKNEEYCSFEHIVYCSEEGRAVKQILTDATDEVYLKHKAQKARAECEALFYILKELECEDFDSFIKMLGKMNFRRDEERRRCVEVSFKQMEASLKTKIAAVTLPAIIPTTESSSLHYSAEEIAAVQKYVEMEGMLDKVLRIINAVRREKSNWVGFPLKRVGDFFKNIFSYTLGFQWVFDLANKSYWLGQRSKYWEVAVITYDDKVNGFKRASITYPLNIVTGWFFPFIFLARHLGKFLGWVFVSPLTIPVYVGLKCYEGAKRFFMQRKIDREIKKMAPQALAEEYCRADFYRNESFGTNPLIIRAVARCVNANDFMAGFIKADSESRHPVKRAKRMVDISYGLIK